MKEKIHIVREAVVKLTQLLSGKGIKVTQCGISAYVKSDAKGRPFLVNLPYIPDNADDQLIQAIQGFLDHEVAHILFTDFSIMGTGNKRLDGMINILEDTRIEREMANRFRGSAQNLEDTGKFYLDKYVTPRLQEAMKKGDKNEIIGNLIVPMIRGLSGQLIFKHYMNDKMSHVQEVYDKIKDLAPEIERAASTKDCVELAKTICKRLAQDDSSSKSGDDGDDSKESKGKSKQQSKTKKKDKKSADTKPQDDEGEGEGDDDGKDESENKSSAKNKDAKDEGDSDDEGDEGDGDGDGKDDKGDGEGDEGEGEGEGEVAAAKAGDGDSEGDGEGGDEGEEGDSGEAQVLEEDSGGKAGGEIDIGKESSALLAAIDKELANDYDSSLSSTITDSSAATASTSDYLVYTKDKDIIEPLKVGKEYRDEMLTSLQDSVDHMVGPLQKDLERAIAARSLSHYSSGHRSGRLHTANLHRLTMNDDRVFRRKEEAASKDVAVTLLVDMSGSMGGGKIHTASKAAYALASVLERIGIVCEVLGFTTGEYCGDLGKMQEEERKMKRRYSRMEALYMPVLKSYNERMTIETKKRFAWLPNTRSMRNNVDGESVEVAARRLMTRREKGKILMVLSDGAPHGYGNTSDLSPHLKRTVAAVTSAGVNVVGIGINSDAVRQYYPKCMVLNNINELPGAVMKELRALIIK